MGESTGISWTDHTFNPWWGCQRVSPGCEHCYAEFLAVTRRKLPVWGPPKTTERQRTKQPWKELLRWNAEAARDSVRRRVFCASMADVFEDHPQVAPWRAEALALLEKCTALDVQLLTKRPENIRRMVPAAWLEAWPAHVWIGTTVEDQKRANERIPHLLNVPARVRFLSCEPLLEAVGLSEWIEPQSHCGACAESCDGSPDLCPSCHTDNLITTWGYAQAERWQTGERYEDTDQGERDRTEGPGISWVIVGGESGSGARPFDLAWARSIVEQCRDAGVAVFVKQVGNNPIMEPGPITWPTIAHHGADPSEWPKDLRVREFPAHNHQS